MTRVELLEKIANTTAEMRSRQRKYFRSRLGAHLTESKMKEKDVDELLAMWHEGDVRHVLAQEELL